MSNKPLENSGIYALINPPTLKKKKNRTSLQPLKLLRIIIAAYPKFNIYKYMTSRTTALGPVMVASGANKVQGWQVEVIDENNCKNRNWPSNDENGLIDHAELQRHRPADIVGFYGSMSSSMPRAYELAKFYKSQGVLTLTGGYHAWALPEESFANGIDLVVPNGGEFSIVAIMKAYDLLANQGFEGEELLTELFDAMSDNAVSSLTPEPKKRIAALAAQKLKERPQCFTVMPDFSLVLYARIKIYPINWRRGCPFNCEFCAVKEKPTEATAEELLEKVEYMYDRFGANNFFIVDDHFGGNLANPAERDELIRTLNMLIDYQKRIGRRLSFAIQIRLNVAEDTELLKLMRQAGIDMVCIGYESPFAEDLKAMKKGISAKQLGEDAAAQMIKWTNMWRKEGFIVHAMMIIYYPKEALPDGTFPPITRGKLFEMAELLNQFIKRAGVDTVQILLTVPLPGTDLWYRLDKEGRLLPLSEIGWEYYDGQFALYDPKDGTTPEDLQDASRIVMKDFYGFRNIPRLFASWVFHFPRVVFPSVLTLVTFRVKYVKKAYGYWRKKYFRNTKIKAGGYFVVTGWMKKFKESNFLEKLKNAKEALAKKMSNK